MDLVVDKLKIEKYSKYKQSGEAWLGSVPEHWEVKALKAILAERKEKNDPIKTKNILSLSMAKGVTLYSEKGAAGNKAKEDLSAYKITYPNDIVVNSMNVIVGSVGLSKYYGAVSPVYYTLYSRNSETDINYYDNIFQNPGFQMSLFGLGNGILIKKSESSNKLNTIRMRIPMDKLNKVLMPYPPKEEQTSIAQFLQKKIPLIDRAIIIKEKQIELLKERKQILIHKAVTRGINPNVKMKDSGVESIGEIPSSWRVARVKQYSTKISKGTTPSTEGRSILDEGPVRYIKAENIQDGFVTNSPAHFIDERTNSIIKRSQLQENDILFVIAGATLGKVAIVNKNHIPSNTNQAVAFVRPISKVIPQYLAIWLTSSIIKELTWLVAVQSAQPNLAMENLGNFPIILPEIEEQKSILFLIENISVKISTAISLKEKEIEKLKEYKATLINSAVTGKIKVC